MLDFLLFENFHLAKHHKMDVVFIARMLKSQGLHVAIFDIYHEDKADEIEGIPVMHWTSKNPVPDDSWMLRKHSLWETFTKFPIFRRQLHGYMLEVKTFIEDKAQNFYCGSYHNGISTVLFDIQKPCYWWGLRSERFRFSIRKMFPLPSVGFHILQERRKFLANPYQRLFISNNIILEEHLRLGIPHERMVIREERVIEHSPNPCYDKLNSKFTFLTIGQLRADKRIEYALHEFSKLKESSQYILAGKSRGQYENNIKAAMYGKKNVVRINQFLSYSDFNELIIQSQFVILADKPTRGTVTNGTMMEAFMNFRPIVAPDYNPYKFYIEKYNLGILYNPDIPGDLARAMNQAINQGCQKYKESMSEFLRTIMFDKVAKNLVENINSIM